MTHNCCYTNGFVSEIDDNRGYLSMIWKPLMFGQESFVNKIQSIDVTSVKLQEDSLFEENTEIDHYRFRLRK